MTDYPQFTSSSPGPTPLRFTQIVKIDRGKDYILIELTPDGQLYGRGFDEHIQAFVWYPAPAFSSTDLVRDRDLTCWSCQEVFANAFPNDLCPHCRRRTLLPEARPDSSGQM